MESDSRGQEVVRQKGDQRQTIRVVLVALFVLLVVLPMGLWLVASLTSKASRQRALDALVESGDPLSSQAFADLFRTAPLSPEASELIANYRGNPVLTYEVPDAEEDTAAPSALTALGYSAETPPSELEGIMQRLLDFPRTGKLPKARAELRRLEAWLEDMEEPLALAIDEQTALRFEQGLTTWGHFWDFAWDFSSALLARTHLRIQSGDFEGALESQTVALAFAVDQGPPVGFRGRSGAAFQRSMLTVQLAMIDALLDAAPDLDARSLLPLIPEGTVRERAIQSLTEERALELERLGLAKDGQLISDRPTGDMASAAGLSLNWELAAYLDGVAQILEDLRSGAPTSTATAYGTSRSEYLPNLGEIIGTVAEVSALEERLAKIRLRLESD